MNILSCIDNFYSRDYGVVRRRVDNPIQTMDCTETEPTEFVHKKWQAEGRQRRELWGAKTCN
jgi:hypothetical protein